MSDSLFVSRDYHASAVTQHQPHSTSHTAPIRHRRHAFTIDLGLLYVGTIYTCHGYQKDEVLYYAAAAEYKQTHPIALAILEEASRCQLNLPEIGEAEYEVGYGIRVSLSDQLIRVGSARFIEMEGIVIPSDIKGSEHEAHELGYSLVYVAIDHHLGGAREQ
jgi:Cu2+-exporting ATPase